MRPSLFAAACAVLLAPQARAQDIAPFTGNVLTHVMLHELAHGLIREFGLPVLANEEVMADSFATLATVQILNDRAERIVTDRAASWRIEDAQAAGRHDPRNEHPSDIRRAYQALCLLYGADPAAWGHIATDNGFSQRQADACSDTAPDQMDGWMAILAPHLRPPDDPSDNVAVILGEGPYKAAMEASGVMTRMGDIARLFDWPEQITLQFDHCDGGAGWSRTERRILICDDLVIRFNAQALLADSL